MAQVASLLEEGREERVEQRLLPALDLAVVQQLVGQEGAGVLHPVEVVRQPQASAGAGDEPDPHRGVVGGDGAEALQELDLRAQVVGGQVGRQLKGVVLHGDGAAELGGRLLEAAFGDPAPRARDVEPGVHLERSNGRRACGHTASLRTQRVL